MRLFPLWSALVLGCGAAPDALPPLPPAEPTPAGRAAHCAAALERQPDDEALHACYREAMTRLGRLPEALDVLTRARAARPDDPRRWYFEVRARLIHDPAGAAHLAVQCRERLADAPWCVLAEGLAREQAGDLAGALERIEAVAGRLQVAPAWAAEARLRLAAGQRLVAVDRLGSALKSDATLGEVLVTAALFSIAAGDQTQAERFIGQAIERSPDAAAPLLTRSRMAVLLGDFARATDDLRAALVADPDHGPAREALARLLQESGQTEAALEHLHLLVDRSPQRSDLMVRLGEALLARGDGERALGWADLALGAQPDDRDALALRVRALIHQGETEEAVALRPRLFRGATDARYRVAVARAWADAQRTGRAEAEFAEAVAAHPRDPEVWRAAAAFALRQGRPDRAATFLRRGVEANPEAAVLHAEMARLFELSERLPDAQVAMAQAARLDPGEPDHEDELARLELANEEVHAAIQRWEALLARHPRADRARLRLSRAYRDVGRLDDAEGALRNLIAHNPLDGGLKGQLGEVLVERGRVSEAIPVLREALAHGGDRQGTKALLAAALADTGAATEADSTFRSALEEAPANRSLRLLYARFLERRGQVAGAAALYRAQLARDPADTEVQRRLEALPLEKVEQFRWPAALSDPDLAALAARVPAEDEPAAVLRDERHVIVDEQGVATVRHVRSVLVRRPPAVERHHEALVGFHAAQPPEVVRARTLTPDGTERPLKSQLVRNPNAGTPLHGDARTLVLRFDAVEPGAIVDYEVITRRPHPDLVGVWWDGYILGNVEPTMRVRYTLERPKHLPVHAAAAGLPEPTRAVAGDTEILQWSREDVPGYNMALSMNDAPGGCEQRGDCPAEIPAVHVSSMQRWAEVDAWYHGLFAPQATPTASLQDKARSLVAGLPLGDRRARIGALYAHVDRQVKYLGIEFGIGAYQPRPAEATLATGRGDCKDMTALMAALLAAEGIPAYPALVRPRDQGRFLSKLPSPGQFSHVLLYVPDPKGDLWLDATAGMVTLTAVPTALRGQTALVVDGRGGHLRTIPLGRPGASGLTRTLTWHLTPLGTGRLEAVLQFAGDLAGGVRQRLLAIDPAGREALVASPGYLLGEGRAPREVAIDALERPDQPLAIHATVDATPLAEPAADGRLIIPFETGFLTDVVPAHGPETWMDGLYTFENRLRIVPPPGYRFDWKPLRLSRTPAGARITVEERRKGGETEIVSRFQLLRLPTDLANHRRMVAELRDAVRSLEAPLPLVRTGPADPTALLAAVASARPDDLRAQIVLARALFEANERVAALEVLQRAERLGPDDPLRLMLLAAVNVELDRPGDAVPPLRRLVERGDAEAPVFGMLAAALLEQGEAAAAVEVLETARRRFPDLPAIERAYILALARNGQGAKAVEHAERHAARAPEERPRLTFLGDLAADVGQPDVAERAYRRALALAPDDPHVLNNLAWMLRDLPARLAEAIELATRAVTLDPRADAAWDTLAELRFREGRFDLAIEAIEEALRLDPESPRYREARARYAAAQAR